MYIYMYMIGEYGRGCKSASSVHMANICSCEDCTISIRLMQLIVSDVMLSTNSPCTRKVGIKRLHE